MFAYFQELGYLQYYHEKLIGYLQKFGVGPEVYPLQ